MENKELINDINNNVNEYIRDIKENIDDLKKDLENYDAMLLAVTKTHGVDKIMEVYDYGLRDFGENKVQELIEKKEKMPKDINWHLIGHLQTNKVNKIVGEVHLIHSVDSLKILKRINNRAKSLSIVQDCLIQVNVSKEESKSGFFVDEIDNVIKEAGKLDNFSNIFLSSLKQFLTKLISSVLGAIVINPFIFIFSLDL